MFFWIWSAERHHNFGVITFRRFINPSLVCYIKVGSGNMRAKEIAGKSIFMPPWDRSALFPASAPTAHEWTPMCGCPARLFPGDSPSWIFQRADENRSMSKSFALGVQITLSFGIFCYNLRNSPEWSGSEWLEIIIIKALNTQRIQILIKISGILGRPYRSAPFSHSPLSGRNCSCAIG